MQFQSNVDVFSDSVLCLEGNVNRTHDREKLGNRRELLVSSVLKNIENSMTLLGASRVRGEDLPRTQNNAQLFDEVQMMMNIDRTYPFFNFKDQITLCRCTTTVTGIRSSTMMYENSNSASVSVFASLFSAGR